MLIEELGSISDLLAKYRNAAFSLTSSDVVLVLLYFGAARTVFSRFVYDNVKIDDSEIPVLRTQVQDDLFFKKTPLLVLVARKGEKICIQST